MATTGSGFFKFTAGATVLVLAKSAATINDAIAALSGTRLDQWSANLASAGFAKNGASRIALSGTTPKNSDLMTLSTAADSYAGDVLFATFSQLIFYNDGTAAVTVTPAVSLGASLGFTSLTIPANSTHILNFAMPVVVDATHKDITVTPAATGSLCILVGGA